MENPRKFDFLAALKGDYLNLEFLSKHLVYMLFVLVLVILGIYSSHRAESKTHELSRKKKQLHELQSNFVETRTKLMVLSNESGVKLRAAELGLVTPEVPPRKITTSHEQ
jgi:hypothetical protein